jgi:two-component sensor histidine kinase
MLKQFNILNRFYLLFSLIFSLTTAHAQTGYTADFVAYFNKQSLTGKVNSLDTMKSPLKPLCYTLVKPQLEAIRAQAMADNKDEIITRLDKIDAELFFMNRNYSKAIPIFTDLLIKNRIKTDKDSAEILYFLKNSYVNIHSLKKATDIHKILLGLKQRNDKINSFFLHPKLSTLYYEMKLYKECLSQQLLEYDEMKTTPQLLIGYFNNRGLFWGHYGNQDSALVCYNKARTLFYQMHVKDSKLSLNDEFTIGLIEGNIGQAYIELKDYYKAIPLLKKDVITSIRVGNKVNAAISEIELSKCYMLINQMDLCKKYLDSANTRLQGLDDYKSKLSVLKQYTNYYEKIGASRLCIDYYKRYEHFKDSVDAQEGLKEVVSSQIANQMQEKESMILENQKKIKERNAELSKQKNIKNALFFGGVVLILIIIVVSRQLKKTNAQKLLLELKNKQIETRNDIINKSLEEKDLLIKEVHHRVKNNLQIISSLLKLQAGKTQNPEILNSLKEAQDRINSMALLHQLLYRNNEVTRLLFNEYLSSLVLQISSSFALSGKNITVESRLTELELDLDTSIPLGLITNELMSNAYKHAFTDSTSGEITVELSKLFKNTYLLKISDNGKGLPENFNINNLHSLGLDIVSILADQISAELKIYNDKGAHFEIHFVKK